jgi:hypothetical protein
MRPLLLISLLLLTACTESMASRVDDRTFRIEGPAMASAGDAANRRKAAQLCPRGYYVVDSDTHKGGMDRATDESNPITVWTIRCI